MSAVDRHERIRLAEQQFEDHLERSGESVCISSLPLLVEELATDAAGDDEALSSEIELRLRRRAGLHT
ncbi:MAG: hypothetical protein ACRDQC_14480 [Gaiellales bacterium]